MLKRRFAKVSIVAIIFVVASSFVLSGIMIYSTAQTPPEKQPITVGILDPDYGDTISGEIMIRAMILHSHPSWGYTISVLINGTEISSSVPFEWDSTTEDDGWWNITVRVTDTHGNVGSDEVLIYVENNPLIDIYYCSSQSEIEDALDTIGIGHGRIIITEDITLTSQIDINDGGRYIIQGAGPITLDRNADDETFYISNVKSCTIRDLIIDASDITSLSISGIYVSEGNDNPVYIKDLQIGGGDAGRGVDINSENVWIQNCNISGFQTGIYLGSNSGYCHILDNSLGDMDISSGNAYGILLYKSDSNTFTGNKFNNIKADGFALVIYIKYSDSNTFTGNRFNNIEGNAGAHGINVQGNYNIFSCNSFSWFNSLSGHSYGIFVTTSGAYNTIIGNVIRYFWMAIQLSGDYNAVVGNIIVGCTYGISDAGGYNEIANNPGA